MAREQKQISLEDSGNRHEFIIRQMPATQLYDWIIRALLLVAGSGTDVPDGADLQKAGAYLADKGIGALSTLDYEKARPLLDELLECCYRKLDKHEERCTRQTVDGYIEDVRTLFKLQVEAAKLNLGFLKAEVEKLSGSRINQDTGAL